MSTLAKLPNAKPNTATGVYTSHQGNGPQGDSIIGSPAVHQ
jgi:hypothetical protein